MLYQIKSTREKIHIWVFSGPCFAKPGLISLYSVSLRIQSEFGKIQTSKTPNTDTLHAVKAANISNKTLHHLANTCFKLTDEIQVYRKL